MKVSDYIVKFFIEKGATDVFGLPGGVVLDLLYSLHIQHDKITPHLNYHEQAAAFAACGYAQVFCNLGIAYSTKGPGVTNMVTGITDAFCDSIPVFFISAHSKISVLNLRFEENQEYDTIQMVQGITKYASRITDTKDIRWQLEFAYEKAFEGRPGPVFLDFAVHVLQADIEPDELKPYQCTKTHFDSSDSIIGAIKSALSKAKRPVLLIGDGIRQAKVQQTLHEFANSIKIPVLSSRFAQDSIPDSKYYYGYIGSHGMRYSNFILSKCDLLISLGNRLAYNPNSKSFEQFTRQAKIIRIDVDTNEFERYLPGAVNFHADLQFIMPELVKESWIENSFITWVDVCNKLHSALKNYDISYPITIISEILKTIKKEMVITSDVGNNEFWLALAYTFSGITNRILYSKSFGALGCSLAKAIGAYYATHERVLCFTGDQGFQMNIQELQFIAHERLPVTVVILNNTSSGMIRIGQKQRFDGHFVHTTLNSGYSVPNFNAIANSYGISYHFFTKNDTIPIDILFTSDGPQIIEILIDEDIDVLPKLPKNHSCQNFIPELEKGLYEQLDKM
ncbi:acetolactate synthase [Spirochaetia bacterium]|nr:acetolactate synthase [Spirochaetia bacterium]